MSLDTLLAYSLSDDVLVGFCSTFTIDFDSSTGSCFGTNGTGSWTHFWEKILINSEVFWSTSFYRAISLAFSTSSSFRLTSRRTWLSFRSSSVFLSTSFRFISDARLSSILLNTVKQSDLSALCSLSSQRSRVISTKFSVDVYIYILI